MREWLNSLWLRIRSRRSVRRLEQDLRDEVAFHLEMREEQLRAAGTNDARRHARLRFGNTSGIRETLGERWALAPTLGSVLRDVRYAMRALRRNPGFSVSTIAVLALAIGANTTVFSVMNAVLFRPLPFRAPQELVMLWSEVPTQGIRAGRTAYATTELWRTGSRTIADTAVLDPVSATLTTALDTEQVSVGRISANLFPLLGVQPELGRLFTADEAATRQRVAVISHRLWQSRLGGSANAINSSIVINGIPSTVVGVLPADTALAFGSDIWEPHTLFPDWNALRFAQGTGSWFVVARLQSGATVEQAQTEMSAIAHRLADLDPSPDRNQGISVMPLDVYLTGARPRTALRMLACAVFCVLLIAATNVAGLVLARHASREREFAVRAALGAGRARLLRQLLTESATLAVMSGIAGAVVATIGIRLIRLTQPVELARLSEVRFDARTFGVTLALSALTGLLLGSITGLTAMRRNALARGRDGGRSVSSGVATRRLRRVLVATEFALAVVLLVGAGLLVRSFWAARSVDLGFDPARVLSISMQAPNPAEAAAFYDRVLQEVRVLPGVANAALVGDLFVNGSAEQTVVVEGSARPVPERMRLRRDEISGDFFVTLRVPLLAGRTFSAADGPNTPRVAIVNETMARRLWPGQDAIGRRFGLGQVGNRDSFFTVVGVAADMRRQGLENEPGPQMFEPVAQNPSRLATLVVRSLSDSPLQILPSLQAAVRRVDTHAPRYRATTLVDRLGGYLAERRFEMSLLIGFALAALLMATIGIYGLIQYSISTRTQEIAIRVAIGADAGSIFRMILREGLALSVAGLTLGLIAAALVSRFGASLLFGVSATDPWTFAITAGLLVCVAVAAGYFPARRAMRISPVVALRQG